MDEMRRAALAERTEVMARTRADADAQVAAAGEKLQAEVDQARRLLTAEADKLGNAAAERILGRTPAS
jgi:F0F1-type ATP synthase membrane subunit b/b'